MIDLFQLTRTSDIKLTDHQSIGWGGQADLFGGYIEYLRESVVFGSNTSYTVPPSWTLRYTCTSTNHPYSSKFLPFRVSCNSDLIYAVASFFPFKYQLNTFREYCLLPHCYYEKVFYFLIYHTSVVSSTPRPSTTHRDTTSEEKIGVWEHSPLYIKIP